MRARAETFIMVSEKALGVGYTSTTTRGVVKGAEHPETSTWGGLSFDNRLRCRGG